METMKALKAPSRTKTTKNSWGHAATPSTQGPLTLSKSEVIGSLRSMGIVGFGFGIGFMIAVKTVNNLEELTRR